VGEQLRTRLGRAGLALVLLSGVLAVSFGAGYRASSAALDDGSAFVQKGETVAHVNGEAGRADAEAAKALAKGKQTLEIVQIRPGVVVVVNNQTGEVSYLPTDTMLPTSMGGGKGGPDAPNDPAYGNRHPDEAFRVAPGSNAKGVYYVDGKSDTLLLIDPKNRKLLPVKLDGKVNHAVVDSHGVAWAVNDDGAVFRVKGPTDVSEVEIRRSDASAKLTLVQDRPVVLLPKAGKVLILGADGVDKELDADPVEGGRDVVALSAPDPGEPVLHYVDRADGTIHRIDLRSGDRSSKPVPGLRGALVGPLVVANGKVYVPKYQGGHAVHVVDGRTLAQVRTQSVKGKSTTFDLFAKDGRVWASDPFDNGLVIFDRDGSPREISKASGKGVDGDEQGEDQDETDPSPDQGAQKPDQKPDGKPNPGQGNPLPSLPKPGGGSRPAGQGSGNRPVESVSVPDVVGQSKDDACRRLEDAGLACRAIAVPDDDADTDEVVETDPDAGEDVPRGRIVRVTYAGPLEVPDLRGLRADDACRQLEDLKLDCKKDTGDPAQNAVELGTVVAQEPAAGESAETGDEITIRSPDEVEVPAVMGQPAGDACTAVQQRGLRCATTDLGQAPSGQPTGVVVQQDPAGGSRVGADRLTITLSFYGAVTVPAVTGADPDSACAAIQQAGLACNRVPDALTPVANQVVGQDPPSNAAAAPGAAVTITYEDTAALKLDRYKAPASAYRDGGHSYVVTTDPAQQPPDFSDQTDLGRAYAQQGVPGLVPIYRYDCARCNSRLEHPVDFFYTQNGGAADGDAAETKWGSPVGVAFFAFQSEQPGTRALMRYQRGKYEWGYALDGSGEEAIFLNAGFGNEQLVGWVWPNP
jgi:beta-lactam-binding protein with PASTA domain